METVFLRKLRSAIAVALMLWCAGTGCMIVSYAHGAAMSTAGTSSTKSLNRSLGDVTASAGSHACCKAHLSAAKIDPGASHSTSRLESVTEFLQVAVPEVPDTSGATSCCPLTSGSFVTTARAESNGDNAAITDQGDSLSLSLSVSHTAITVFPSRLPDQNQTYLRGCAFLI